MQLGTHLNFGKTLLWRVADVWIAVIGSNYGFSVCVRYHSQEGSFTLIKECLRYMQAHSVLNKPYLSVSKKIRV